MLEEIIFKICLIFVLAFLFGIERQLSNKPVGFGTFIFVAVGACTMGVLALQIGPMDSLLSVVGGVLTGIGFIGAGALVRTGDKIFGFTTAASIWIFSIIGLTIGFGYYTIGLISYAAVWLVVIYDRVFESQGIGSYQKKLVIETNRIVPKEEVLRLLGRNKWRLLEIKVDRKNDKSSMTYLISVSRSFINPLKERLSKISWIDSFVIK
jgi:putative Mg2+ transporter-C (MgtC) family protein